MEQGVPSAWPLLPAPALGTPRLTSTFLGHSPLSPISNFTSYSHIRWLPLLGPQP